MTKAELIQSLSVRTGLTLAQVKAVVDGYADHLKADLLTNGLAVVHGIGRLKVTPRAARLGRNPKTGESFNIAATNVVRLTVSKELKEQVEHHCRFLA
ncbi:HU family DNA-binding protein [Salmonella enterica]|nr:HU family DNA-binding protein [Salmonella enterica]